MQEQAGAQQARPLPARPLPSVNQYAQQQQPQPQQQYSQQTQYSTHSYPNYVVHTMAPVQVLPTTGSAAFTSDSQYYQQHYQQQQQNYYQPQPQQQQYTTPPPVVAEPVVQHQTAAKQPPPRPTTQPPASGADFVPPALQANPRAGWMSYRPTSVIFPASAAAPAPSPAAWSGQESYVPEQTPEPAVQEYITAPQPQIQAPIQPQPAVPVPAATVRPATPPAAQDPSPPMENKPNTKDAEDLPETTTKKSSSSKGTLRGFFSSREKKRASTTAISKPVPVISAPQHSNSKEPELVLKRGTLEISAPKPASSSSSNPANLQITRALIRSSHSSPSFSLTPPPSNGGAAAASSSSSSLVWSEIDWNELPATKQSLLEVRAAANQEIASVCAERDQYRQEAAALRKELESLKLARLKDPSLLRPDMEYFVYQIQQTPQVLEKIIRVQQLSRSVALRMRWKHMIRDYKRNDASLAGRRQVSIYNEILSTEKVYVQNIFNIYNAYKRSFDEAIMEGALASLKETEEELRSWSTKLFGNITELLNFNTNVFAVLQEEWKRWPSKPALIGTRFSELAPGLKCYSTYVNNYDEALQLYNRMMKKAPIKALFDSIQKRPSTRNLSLEHLLIMPIQRIPRYELLFRELSRFLPEDHLDYQGVQRSLAVVLEMATWINEERRRWDASIKIRHIMQKYSNCPDFVSQPPSATISVRTLVQKGKLGSGTKKRKYFLLTDFLLFVVPQSTQLEMVIDLRTAQLSDATSGTGKEGALCSIWHVPSDGVVRTYHLECSSVEQKRDFMQCVNAQIAVLLEKSEQEVTAQSM